MAMPSKTAANKGSSTKKRSAARGHVRHAAKKPAKHKRARHKAKRRAKRR
jgi:hypothetical protein